MATRTDGVYPLLLLGLAESFLQFAFHHSRMKDRNTLSWTDFHLAPVPELLELRKTLWEALGQLAKSTDKWGFIAQLLDKYVTAAASEEESEILESDAAHVLSILSDHLDQDSLQDCRLANEYLDQLERVKFDFPKALRERFWTNTFAVFNVVCFEWRMRRLLEMDYREFEAHRQDRLLQFVKGFDLDQFNDFLDHCAIIVESGLASHEIFQVTNSIVTVLVAFADRDPTLFTEAVDSCLKREKLLLPSKQLATLLKEAFGANGARTFLQERTFPNKEGWFLHLYSVLESDEILESDAEHILAIHREADGSQLLYGVDYLLKFRSVRSRIIPEVTSILNDRMSVEDRLLGPVDGLFNPVLDASSMLSELFADSVEVLTQAYLFADELSQHHDYEGDFLNQILDFAPGFISELVDSTYNRARRIVYYHDRREYGLIWLRTDYAEIMSTVVDRVLKHEADKLRFGATYLNSFIQIRKHQKLQSAIQVNQDLFLARTVAEGAHDAELMSLIFDVVSGLSRARQLRLFELFLQHNSSFKAFKRLSIFPSVSSSWSSLVPFHQERIDQLTSIRTLMTSTDFLEHRQFVDDLIREEQRTLELTKKREFMRD